MSSKPEALVPRLRRAKHRRVTKETVVEATLLLDGSGNAAIETGIGFLDHMLDLLSRHGRFDLQLSAKGDLHVDAHHTMEDVGLVLGECVAEALGDKSGVRRFGSSYVPLDEALSRVVVDLSGRPYLAFRATFPTERVGTLPTELFEDFFRAFCDRSRVTMHVDVLKGRNSHHIAETIFKAFGRALSDAVRRTGTGVPLTTKGTLEA